MGLRKIQFIIFLIVPLVNFGVNFFFPSPFDDDAKVLIQPAGYAFSIWGPIFLGMILYSWFQMQPSRVESPHLKKATIYGIAAGLASIAFVPISYMDIQWLSFIDIIWHLIALILLFLALRQQIQLETDSKSPWYYLPTQIYLGWICAATAISVALALTEAGVSTDIETQVIFTVAIIGVLTVLGILMAQQRGIVIPLVFIWALTALIVENGQYVPIKFASMVSILVLALVTGLKLLKGQRLSY
jgi:hypothetical protein